MATTTTITGFYGKGTHQHECNIYVYSDTYLYYYVCHGGSVVNATYEILEDGVNVEEISDVDVFTWPGPITSETELAEAVEY